MLSVLVLKARDLESELVDQIHEIVTHILQNGLSLDEKNIVNNLYNRLCKLGPSLHKVLDQDPLETKTESDDEEEEEIQEDEPQFEFTQVLEEEDACSTKSYEDISVIEQDDESCDSVSSSQIDSKVAVKQQLEEPVTNDESMPYEFTQGARLNSNLLYSIDEKQLYRRKSGTDKTDRYVCNIPKCFAILLMSDGELRKSKTFREHNHSNQEEKYLKNKFEARIKTKLETDFDSSIQNIFEENLKSDPIGGASTKFQKIRRNLSTIRKRQKMRKTNPHSEQSYKKGPSKKIDPDVTKNERSYSDNCSQPEYLDSDGPTLNNSAHSYFCKAEPMSEESFPWADIIAEDSSDSVSSSLMDHLVSVKPTLEDTEPIIDDEPMPYEFTQGAHLNSNLLYSTDEKQLYRRKSGCNNTDRYVCNIPQCCAVLRMTDGVLRKSKTFREHNHFNQEEKYLRNKFVTSVKSKLVSDEDAPIQKIFYEELENDPVGGATIQFHSIKRNLCSIRRRHKQRKLNDESETVDEGQTDAKPMSEDVDESSSGVRCDESFDDVPLSTEPLAYEFTPGARLNSSLLYTTEEKQLYRQKSSAAEKNDRYVCNLPRCPARLVMCDGVLRRTKGNRGHNHPDQEEKYLKNKFEAKLKTQLMEGDVDTIPELFKEHLKSDPVGGANTRLNRIKRNLCRIRQRAKERSEQFIKDE